MVATTTDRSKIIIDFLKSIIKEKENEIATIYSQLVMQKRCANMHVNETLDFSLESVAVVEEKMKVAEQDHAKLIDEFERYIASDRDILLRKLHKEKKNYEEQSVQLEKEITSRKLIQEELKKAKEQLAEMENNVRFSNSNLNKLQEKLTVRDAIFIQKIDGENKKFKEQSVQMKKVVASRDAVEDELKRTNEQLAEMEKNMQTSNKDISILQQKLFAEEEGKKLGTSQMKAAQLKILDLCKKLLKTQNELSDSKAECNAAKKDLQTEKEFNATLTKEFQQLYPEKQLEADQRLVMYASTNTNHSEISNNTATVQQKRRDKKKKKGRNYKSFGLTQENEQVVNTVWGRSKICDTSRQSRENQMNMWPALSSAATVSRVDSGIGLVGRK